MEVPKEAVRIDEMLNYIASNIDTTNYHSFQIHTTLTSCPWNKDNKLLHIIVHTPTISLDHVPPCNLVFLIDISGSMDMPNRLPIIKTAMHGLINQLRDIDTISIVTYGGNVGIQINGISGSNKLLLHKTIDALEASGSTPGSFALYTAFQLASAHFITKGNNRVVLCTDGDFNVGATGEKALEALIEKAQQKDIRLTCLGVGMGNLKDSKLEALANKAKGMYAYIDNEEEADNILWRDFSQTFHSIAHHAVLSIQFDTTVIEQFRLIGYENKSNTTNNITIIEGGELSPHFSTDIIWEITPTQNAYNILDKDSFAFIQSPASVLLKYWSPITDSLHQLKIKSVYNGKELSLSDPYIQLYTSVSMYGSILRQSKHIEKHSLKEIKKIIENTNLLNNYIAQSFYKLVLQSIVLKKKKLF